MYWNISPVAKRQPSEIYRAAATPLPGIVSDPRILIVILNLTVVGYRTLVLKVAALVNAPVVVGVAVYGLKVPIMYEVAASRER